MESLLRNTKVQQKPMTVSTKQQRIAELAALHPNRSFTSLNHHIDEQWLHEAYRLTRKDGAVGVDGVTAQEYEQDLDENLRGLLDRFKSGIYKAPPVKRVHIPKGDKGETRPIGIPALEDKILQRAVVMLMDPIYEHDFLECSYGFRRGRSAHKALECIWQTCMGFRGGSVLDVDIRKFFDNLDHERLRQMLKRRISDGVILRTIGKWLKAGVMENGSVTYPALGSPQGGVISPLLSNVYLHYVLDQWSELVMKPRLIGRMELVRFADDFVMIFTHHSDAERALRVLPHRFGRFGLTIHPDKTRLVSIFRPSVWRDKPETFDFLGFTLHWGKSYRGYPIVKRRTAKDRLQRGLKAIGRWCKFNRHMKVAEQHTKLCQKIRGHFAYYGITHNGKRLYEFIEKVKRIWRYWLNRRNREGRMPWKRFTAFLANYPLPEVRIVHSYAKH